MQWFFACTKKNDLFMGTSLAAILANVRLKKYEPALMKKVQKLTLLCEDKYGICPGCHKKVTN